MVLKLGGELLEQRDDLSRVGRGIAALSRRTRLVVVHGGGKEIDAALDNLVKGAAGSAVQNLNIMLGLDERTGLL